MSSAVPAFLLIACALALGWILQPFWGAILWAVIIALIFLPLYRALLTRLRGRRELAAALVLLVVVLIGVLPLTVVAASLAREAAGLYQRIADGGFAPEAALRALFEALPGWLRDLLAHLGLDSFEVLERKLAATASEGAQLVASRAVGVGLDTFDFISSLFIMLYVAFFLLRDGRAGGHAACLGAMAPAHQQALIDKFSTVIRATVKGNLLVALLQGALGGLAFWVLGLQGALLWAVVMAVLSLLPAIGAALVWGAGGGFLAAGQRPLAAGLGLVAWGTLVIGLVDNLLRPILVGKDTRLPDWVVLMATLGGMAVFGINGFVIGPVIAAMFFAVWHIWVPASAEDD
jgi:predicted PurR-regulated permease PerM